MGGNSAQKLKSVKSQCCNKCGSKKSCSWKGLRHVYVIELTRDVLKSKDYCREDRGRVTDDTRFFYVGQTKHRVECRFRQHRRKKAGMARGFKCTCENGTPQARSFNYAQGNKFVRRYALKPGALRPELFFHYNPIQGRKAALAMEQKVSEELRSLGHLVHTA